MLELLTQLQGEMRTNTMVINMCILEAQKAFLAIQDEKQHQLSNLSSALVNWSGADCII